MPLRKCNLHALANRRQISRRRPRARSRSNVVNPKWTDICSKLGMPQLDYSRGYPRPQLVRDNWTSLNGRWDFAIDFDGVTDNPREVEWDQTIVVPFAPETSASGIGNTELFRA